jgi:peptidyl-prolyl cis-trans isomerase SurA
MKKTFVGPVLLLFLATSAMFAADTVVEEIIARINDQIITRSELQRSREQLITEMRQQFGQQADARASEREKDMLRDLIDQQLLLEKGKDLGITGDTELVKRLDEMRKQMSLSSMEDLEKAAQQQGVSYEEFKNNLRNNIITQAVISREVGSHVQVSAEETKKFYEEHRSEFEVPEQVRLSEILVAIPAAKPDNPQEDEQHRVAFAEAKAQELLALIRSGAQFENVARSNSSGPSAAQGGDLGFFKRGTLAKELEEKTFAMKPGEVSDVIRTKQGFVILKVTEHPQAGLPPMKDVEPRIQEAIYLQKLQPTLRTYLTKLREEAFIDIKPGYADTGASPNQTKPVITVAADEGGKNTGKPKKKKKLLVF